MPSQSGQLQLVLMSEMTRPAVPDDVGALLMSVEGGALFPAREDAVSVDEELLLAVGVGTVASWDDALLLMDAAAVLKEPHWARYSNL